MHLCPEMEPQVDGSGPRGRSGGCFRGQPGAEIQVVGPSVDGKDWRGGGGGRGGMSWVFFFSPSCDLPFCVPACCKSVGGEGSDPGWAERRWLLTTEGRGWASEAQGRTSSSNNNNNNGGGGYEKKKQETPNAGCPDR